MAELDVICEQVDGGTLIRSLVPEAVEDVVDRLCSQGYECSECCIILDQGVVIGACCHGTAIADLVEHIEPFNREAAPFPESKSGGFDSQL